MDVGPDMGDPVNGEVMLIRVLPVLTRRMSLLQSLEPAFLKRLLSYNLTEKGAAL
jgi:hypothetical protein